MESKEVTTLSLSDIKSNYKLDAHTPLGGTMNAGIYKMYKDNVSFNGPETIIYKTIRPISQDTKPIRWLDGDVSVGNIKKEIELLRLGSSYNIGPELYGVEYDECDDVYILYIEAYTFSLNKLPYEVSKLKSSLNADEIDTFLLDVLQFFKKLLDRSIEISEILNKLIDDSPPSDKIIGDISKENIGINLFDANHPLGILDWGSARSELIECNGYELLYYVLQTIEDCFYEPTFLSGCSKDVLMEYVEFKSVVRKKYEVVYSRKSTSQYEKCEYEKTKFTSRNDHEYEHIYDQVDAEYVNDEYIDEEYESTTIRSRETKSEQRRESLYTDDPRKELAYLFAKRRSRSPRR